MKKLFVSFLALAAAATAIISCNKTEKIEPAPKDGYTYSFIINDVDTKATLDEGGVLWENKDRVGMYLDGYTGYAEIDATATPKTVTLFSRTEIPANSYAYAYYPYSTDNTDKTLNKVVFSNIQQGGTASAMPMAGIPFKVEETVPVEDNVARTSGVINFLNLGSIIDFKIFSESYTGETVKYVTFEADKTIAGEAYIDLTGVNADNEETLAVTFMDGENDFNAVKVNQEVEVAASKAEATSIYMVVAPGTYSGTITIGTDVATYTFTYNNKTLGRNVIKHYNMNLNNATRVEEVIEVVKTLPYSEAFTVNQGDFSIEGGTGNEWSFGQYGAVVTGYYQGEGETKKSNHAANTALVSPWIDLTDVADAQLTFSQNRNSYLEDSDVDLMIQEEGSDTWTSLGLILPTKPSSSFSGWKTAAIALADYVGGKVKVKFTYVSTNDNAGTYEFKDFLVDKVKAEAGIAYATTSYEATLGESFTAPTLTNPNNLTVEYSSSNTAAATVNASTGAVTLVAGGITTITATFAGNDDYNEATASYTLTIIDPDATSIIDRLTLSTTGVEGTSYVAWSGKKVISSAVYAGQSAGGNDAIQLRSTSNNSGIITTASGGTLKSVSVEWNSNTAEGRVLNVYGKNTAYADAADLYNESNQGVLLGTITKGTSTTLAISGTYTFIGIRSDSGAMYLDAVEIEWSTAPVVIEEYDVTINPSSNGTVTADPVKAAVGTTVTLTVSPDPGYALASLTVDGLAVTDDVVNNEYAFVMPEHNVAVTATFEEGQSAKTYTITWNSNNNSDAIANYTSEWTVTSDGLTCNMVNWNNNNNGWNYVKAGRKNYESVATISTASAIPEAIKTVTLTIDAVTASKINSLTLSVAADKAFTNATEYSFNVATGNQVVTIPAPAANMYYRITADCASGSSNGLITVSKLAFATN